MNYKRHYDLLIERAKSRKIEGYFENHHIVPKCIGGSGEETKKKQSEARKAYWAKRKAECLIQQKN